MYDKKGLQFRVLRELISMHLCITINQELPGGSHLLSVGAIVTNETEGTLTPSGAPGLERRVNMIL
jgi:hypothetical protein